MDVFDGVKAARRAPTRARADPVRAWLRTHLIESYPTRTVSRWYEPMALCIQAQHMHM